MAVISNPYEAKEIGLQIVSEFRSESMNSNSSSETSPLPDYIFHPAQAQVSCTLEHR